MNVVKRETRSLKTITKPKKYLIRKDNALGIRGVNSIPVNCYKTASSMRKSGKDPVPRYQFNVKSLATTKRSSMGPPPGPPPSVKRKSIISNSTEPGYSSSSHYTQPRVLASDSCPADTSDLYTPKNRPTALRYISSSSRGGHSSIRSARSTSTSMAQASLILALSEGRGMARGEIGMAAIDLQRPHLILCQFSDTLLYTHTLTKINYFNPIEVFHTS